VALLAAISGSSAIFSCKAVTEEQVRTATESTEYDAERNMKVSKKRVKGIFMHPKITIFDGSRQYRTDFYPKNYQIFICGQLSSIYFEKQLVKCIFAAILKS